MASPSSRAIHPWTTKPLFLSTDACQTGADAFFNGYFFHTPFPDSLLATFGHNINTLKLLTIMAALKLWPNGVILFRDSVSSFSVTIKTAFKP